MGEREAGRPMPLSVMNADERGWTESSPQNGMVRPSWLATTHRLFWARMQNSGTII